MCVCPLYLKSEGMARMVSCGQCRECRLRRKAAWVGRLRLELKDHAYARFLTLTYSTDPGILDVKDLADFLKRYRYHYGPCRFFGVGEYGSKGGRGHWHLIVYGHAPETVGHWKNNKAWDAGYSFDGTVTVQSIGYVGGYVLKDVDRLKKAVCRQSLKPGLGFRQIDQMALAALKTPLEVYPTSYLVGGKRYPLCAGGLARFQSTYLESGGVPPIKNSPESLHLAAVAQISDWGTRISQEKRAEALSFREVVDAHATARRR